MMVALASFHPGPLGRAPLHGLSGEGCLPLARIPHAPASSRVGLSLDGIEAPFSQRPEVQAVVAELVGPGRVGFARWLQRLDSYRGSLQPLLARQGVPPHALYLAMVESTLDPKARSRSGAVGLWQMMPTTARAYGLKVGALGDERVNVEASTTAAATYLSDLRLRFGDWLLVWAAYNAGGGHVARAMAEHRVDDFWSLAAISGALSAQTRSYVPKILAVAHIEQNRVRYGFAGRPIQPPSDGGHAGQGHGELGPLPVGLGALRAEAALPRFHEVAPGDTLWGIAERYGLTLDSLKALNRVHESRLAVGRRLRLR